MITSQVKQSETMVSQPRAQHSNPLTFLYSNLTNTLPGPIIGLIQEYYATPKEIAEFLTLVAEGEQDQAEAMLKSNPDLALVSGDVTDLSKRTFTDITGFQYAVWALDWHMWTMIKKYLPDAELKKQVECLETGAWVENHGTSAEEILSTLMKAYDRTRSFYNTSRHTESNKAWIEEVGGAQRLIPVHVVNEYCHPTRSFYPRPDFNNDVALPRSRATKQGEWFSLSYNGGLLGEKSAVQRGGSDFSWCMEEVACRRQLGRHNFSISQVDLSAIHHLKNTRVMQWDELLRTVRLRAVSQ